MGDLRRRFNREKRREVPKELDKRIGETLNSLEYKAEKLQEKRRKKGYKRLIVAASILLSVGGITAGANIDSKFKESMYNTFGYNFSEEEIKTVGETTSKKGIDFTVEEMVSDGYKIFITYSIKGDNLKEIKETLYVDPKINGKEVFGGLGAFNEKLEDGQIKGIGYVNVGTLRDKDENLYKDKDIKKIELAVKNEDKEILKYEIDKEKITLAKDVKSKKIDIKTKFGNLNECIVTPFNVYLIGEKNEEAQKHIKEKGFVEREDFVLMDKEGIINNYYTGDISGNGKAIFMEFKNDFKDLSELTVLDNLTAIENNFKEFQVEIRDGKLKKGFKNSDVEILSVENRDGKAYIKYKMKQPNLRGFGLAYEKHPYFNDQINPISREVSELVLTNGILEDGKYTFEYIDNGGYKLKEIGKIHNK